MKILILDGNNISWMAFGRSPLVFNGQRTELVKIGLSMVRGYLEQFRPDFCFMIWDGGRNKQRTELYPEYKKRSDKELTEVEVREKESFFQQLSQLRDALQVFGIDQVRCTGEEADDVIFTLVDKFAEELPESEVTVVSTDQDMMQLFLVADNVKVFSPVKNKLYGAACEVERELGFPLQYLIAYKAMVGDSSDNLPGIRGIGPAGAKTLIQFFVDGIQTPKVVSLLKKWDMKQFEKMVNLIMFMDVGFTAVARANVTVNVELNDLHYNAQQLCEQYGFDQWLQSMASFVDPFDSYLRRRSVRPCVL